MTFNSLNPYLITNQQLNFSLHMNLVHFVTNSKANFKKETSLCARNYVFHKEIPRRQAFMAC
jgi:hypothetical protein